MDVLGGIFQSKQGKTNILGASLRLNFMRKVFGIVSLQLVVTSIICYYSMISKAFLQFQMQQTFLFGLSCIVALVIPIILTCFRTLARTTPTNYILLGIFTLSESYTLSFICSISDPKLVLLAATLTSAITICLTVYALTTKEDFTLFRGTIWVILFSACLVGFVSIFTQNRYIEMLYLLLGITVYGIYLVYDVQLIMGGKRGNIDIDDYIFASMMIYMDIIALFIKILKFLQKLKEDDQDNKKKQ